MNTRLLTVIISVLLIAATIGLWFLGGGELVSLALTMNIKDVPTSNIVETGLILVVAILGLLSRWKDSKERHDE